MMKFKLIGIVLAVICVLVRLPAREPLRVGIDVPEPKLIEKVEVSYPEPAKIGGLEGPVVLKVSIDEQGNVTGVRGLLYNPILLESAKSAVGQWRFSPTLLNGKAVPVTANVVILFALSRTPAPLNLEITGQWEEGIPRGFYSLPILMDRAGNLESIKRRSYTSLPSNISLIPDSQVPFSVIEKKIKSKPAPIIELRDPKYHFPIVFSPDEYMRPGVERLYYSALFVCNGSHLFYLAGVNPSIEPPKLDIDFTRLNKLLVLLPQAKSGAVFFYTVFVDKTGRILGVQGNSWLVHGIIETLSRAKVIKPGLRNGIPVPTAVVLAIPVK